MSKSVKMIVGVVAAVAIPFAAPALASAMISSAALGGAITGAGTALGLGAAGTLTATSALTGAALGAASAAATGGDVGKGALFGGLGGGLGGYASATKAAQAGQAASQAGQAGQAASTAAPVGTNTVLAPTATTAAPSAGGVSSGFDTASYLSGVTGSGSGAGAAGGQLAGITGQTAGAGLSVPYSPSPTGTALPNPPTTWGGRFKAGLEQGWDRVTSPENIANTALEGAKYLAGSVAAGSGLTDEQEALMRAQQQEMKRAREANDAVFNTRRDEALKLINEANYYDPEYMGLQRARQEQLRGARAKQAGLRGLNTPARTAEARRYDLGTSRATGAAYDQGYQSGVQQRTNVRAAGLAALPSGYQTTTSDYGVLASQMDRGEEQRRRRAQDIGNLFGDFSGKREAESLGG